MKVILTQLGSLLGFLLLVYCLSWLLTFFVFPIGSNVSLDTFHPEESLYGNWFRVIVMNRSPLMGTTKKVIVLGSSNAIYGFRPPDLQPLMPGFAIHNLGIPLVNISVMQKVLDLCYEVLPRNSDKEVVVVLGLWYGMFVDNESLVPSGAMLLEQEQFRYGLYRDENGHLSSVVHPELFPYVVQLLRPSLALLAARDRYIQPALANFKTSAREFLRTGDFHGVEASLFGAGPNIIQGRREDLDTVVVSEDHKKTVLDFWRAYMGTADGKIRDEQFQDLLAVVEFLRDRNVRLILVDLPLPKWHEEGIPHFRDYQERKLQFLHKATTRGKALYLNLQDMDDDFAFFDSVHPKPRVALQWADRIARFIEDSLDGQE